MEAAIQTQAKATAAAHRTPIGRLALAWLAGATLLLWPLLLNRSPILFFDSDAYLRFGRLAWEFAGQMLMPGTGPQGVGLPPDPGTAPAMAATANDGTVMSGRSYFYSVWAGASGGRVALVAVAQALWMSAALIAALPHLGFAGLTSRVAIIALLGVATPLAFFVCTLLPDMFAGLAPLSVAMLFAFPTRMRWPERLFWLATLLAVLLFHRAYVGLTILMLGVGVAGALLRQWKALPAALLIGLTIVAAALLDRAATTVVERAVDAQAVSPPFLLARGIGDGTIAAVLQADCTAPQAAQPWAACALVPKLPLTENGVLWGSRGLSSLSPDQRQAVIAEQGPLVAEVLKRDPLTQIGRSLQNSLVQFVGADLSEWQDMVDRPATAAPPERDHAIAFAASPIGQGQFPLQLLSDAWRIVYLCAFAAAVLAAGLLSTHRHQVDRLLVAVSVLLLLALVLSAAMTGTLVGPFGRYQARIAWLALLALMVLLGQLRASLQAREQAIAQRSPA
jgi:hypothetical protein